MKTVQDYAKILDRVKNFDTDSITELDIIDIICDLDCPTITGIFMEHMKDI